MKKILILFLTSITLLLANDFRPVMIYDSDLLDDKSWNTMIHKGIKKFKKRFKVDVHEVAITDSKEFYTKVKDIANQGYNPIMVNDINADQQKAIKEITLEYPKKRFIIFNGVFNIPNADFYVFSYQEATFLAGYLAAKTSKSGKIGLVGGMHIPVIDNYLCGYIKGARYANPKVEVLHDYIGKDFTAWNNPKKGYAIAKTQIKKGADIIFAPAGGSSVGILEAAKDAGKLGIGVDSNQNYLYPGSVLTSVVVRVDNAVYMALTSAYRGIWRDHVKTMGLQEKGVSLAYDKYNKPLISKKLKEEITHIQSDIILNKIKIPNYVETKECIIDGEKLF